jgi:hypothetical protein
MNGNRVKVKKGCRIGEWVYRSMFSSSRHQLEVSGSDDIAQALFSWIPTAAARAQARVRPCEIFGRRSGNEEGFLQVFQFSLPIIPPTVPYSLSGAEKIGQIMAKVPSLTPRQEARIPARKLPVGVRRAAVFVTAEHIRRGLTQQSDA